MTPTVPGQQMLEIHQKIVTSFGLTRRGKRDLDALLHRFRELTVQAAKPHHETAIFLKMAAMLDAGTDPAEVRRTLAQQIIGRELTPAEEAIIQKPVDAPVDPAAVPPAPPDLAPAPASP